MQVGQTSEALNAARKEVEQADRDAAAVAKKADDLTAAAGRKSKEAEEYRYCLPLIPTSSLLSLSIVRTNHMLSLSILHISHMLSLSILQASPMLNDENHLFDNFGCNCMHYSKCCSCGSPLRMR